MKKLRAVLRKLADLWTQGTPDDGQGIADPSMGVQEVSPKVGPKSQGEKSALTHSPQSKVWQTHSGTQGIPPASVSRPLDHLPNQLPSAGIEKPDRLLKRKLIRWGLIGAVAVLMSLSIKLHEVTPFAQSPEEATKSWLLELSCIFLLEIGVGIIVACILARTLESYLHRQSQLQHRRQIRRLQQHTLEALFGIHVERELYDELASAIFSYKLRRKDFTILYQFEPAVEGTTQIGPDDRLKVTVTVSYKLVNVARHFLKHCVRHYFEMLLPEQPEIQDYKRLKIRGCQVEDGEEGILWEGESLKNHLKTEGVRRVVSTLVGIQPEQSAEVEFTYVILKRAADTDIWLSTIPADGFRIMAVIDKRLHNVQFWPDAVHWEEPIQIRHVPEGGLRIYEWRINNVILPNQGIMLFWRPEDRAIATPGREEAKEVGSASTGRPQGSSVPLGELGATDACKIPS